MVWVNGIIAGVHEIDWASEGVEVLMNDVWNSPVIEFGYVSSRTQWVKLKFSRVKVFAVVVYSPTEWDGENGSCSGMTCWTGGWIEEVISIECVFWEI